MQLEKETSLRRSEAKRRYDDACGLAHALELVGERWAMLVLRELAYGPRRFSELKADLAGISANVLAQRLTEMESRGLVRKARLKPPASVQVYAATQWGLEAVPIIAALGRWAARSPLHDPTLPMSPVSVMMSLETMFDPGLVPDGFETDAAFVLRGVDFHGRLHSGRFRVERGSPQSFDFRLTAEPERLVAVVYGGAPLESVAVEGDMAAAERFVSLFPLPPKVA